jgi:hypothetical protein
MLDRTIPLAEAGTAFLGVIPTSGNGHDQKKRRG